MQRATANLVCQLLQARPPQQRFKFCNLCGGPIAMAVPPGESELRHVCQQCSAVSYLNPKMVSMLHTQALVPALC